MPGHAASTGVLVSVLATGPKVRGFKPSRSDGFLKATIIRSTPSFGGKVNPSAPWRKILRKVNITSKYEQKYLARPNP
jgi:hypothetical protein